METLSKRVKELRIKNNYTQKYVFIKIGTTEKTYRYIENGKAIPKIPTLLAIADLYGVSVDYLLGRTDRPEVLK